MSGDSSRLLVSPFVEEIDVTRCDEEIFLPTLDPHAVPRWRELRRSGQLHALYDLLERRLVWCDGAMQELLRRHRVQLFVGPTEAVERGTVARLAAAGLLLSEARVERSYRLERAAVEINSHCNYRCGFCPVATAPLPKRFMEDATFALVLRRIVEAEISVISLSLYGEPTLDPELVTRVRQAARHGLFVELYSNASRLDTDYIRALAAVGNLRALIVNLPSLNAETFTQATGWKNLDGVLSNIRAAVAHGLPVRLYVNVSHSIDDSARDAARAELRAELGVPVAMVTTQSRAGNVIDPSWVRTLRHSDRLSGCHRFFSALAIDVEGHVILCGQDYQRALPLGDLAGQSIRQIMEAPEAVRLRRAILGLDPAPVDLLCRSCSYSCSATGELALGSTRLWAWPPPGELAKEGVITRDLASLPQHVGFSIQANDHAATSNSSPG